MVCDEEWRLRYINRTAADHAGLPRAEMIGQAVVLTKPTEFTMLYEHSGKRLTFQAFPFRGGLASLSRDVTEQKRAEDLAEVRLAEPEDLSANAPMGLCVLDHDLRFIRINDRLAEINGIPAAEHLGRTLREMLPELADTAEPAMRRILATGEAALDLEITGETPAQPGVQRTWMERWLPIKGADGRVTGLSIVVEETTKRKQAEGALRESAERFAVLFEKTAFAMTPVSFPDGVVTAVNEAWERLFVYARQEVVMLTEEIPQSIQRWTAKRKAGWGQHREGEYLGAAGGQEARPDCNRDRDCACRQALFEHRFPRGFLSPRCGQGRAWYLRRRGLYECTACHYQGSLTAGTIFQNSRTAFAQVVPRLLALGLHPEGALGGRACPSARRDRQDRLAAAAQDHPRPGAPRG